MHTKMQINLLKINDIGKQNVFCSVTWKMSSGTGFRYLKYFRHLFGILHWKPPVIVHAAAANSSLPSPSCRHCSSHRSLAKASLHMLAIVTYSHRKGSPGDYSFYWKSSQVSMEFLLISGTQIKLCFLFLPFFICLHGCFLCMWADVLLYVCSAQRIQKRAQIPWNR